MSDTLITVASILTPLVTAAITALTSWRVITHRLSALEKKVDKHNHIVERMAVVETKIYHLEKEVKGA